MMTRMEWVGWMAQQQQPQPQQQKQWVAAR
jgi:hypothetical protein